MSRCFVLLTVLTLLGTGLQQARADNVLLLSTGNTTNDSDVVTLLTAEGHTVTVGPDYYNLTNTTNLSAYTSVILLQNSNGTGMNIPALGQTALVNYVNSGGGLLTGEWTVYSTGGGVNNQTLMAILPVVSTTTFNTAASIMYQVATPNPDLNYGLPSSFTFTADDNAGTETFFTPLAGATTYYSSGFGAGVVGWTYGAGNVLSFSTLAGPLELGDPNYGTLFSNSVYMVEGQSIVPEPSTLTLLAMGAAGLAIFGRRQWRRAAEPGL